MAKIQYLIWRGGDPYPGWPASDHEEPDAKVYQAKLASKLYRTADDKEDEVVLVEKAAAKALANAQAAADAQAEAERAQVAADEAARLAADRKANLAARIAAAQRTIKEVEGGKD